MWGICLGKAGRKQVRFMQLFGYLIQRLMFVCIVKRHNLLFWQGGLVDKFISSKLKFQVWCAIIKFYFSSITVENVALLFVVLAQIKDSSCQINLPSLLEFAWTVTIYSLKPNPIKIVPVIVLQKASIFLIVF